jgi:hypothetical protein
VQVVRGGPGLVLNSHAQAQTDFFIANAGYIGATDMFVLVTGNNANAVNMQSVNGQAAQLRAVFPACEIWAYTAGQHNPDNVTAVASQASSDIAGVIYGYEPGMPNEPEFSDFDFALAAANIRAAAEKIHAHGKLAGAGPSGRPADWPGNTNTVHQYAWNYGQFMNWLDFMIVQTQTWARTDRPNRPLQYVAMIGWLAGISGPSGPVPGRWAPQITISAKAINGCTPEQAVLAYQAAPTSLLSIWSLTREMAMVEEFFRLMRSAPEGREVALGPPYLTHSRRHP